MMSNDPPKVNDVPMAQMTVRQFAAIVTLHALIRADGVILNPDADAQMDADAVANFATMYADALLRTLKGGAT